jgi:hypothetical protein
MAVRLNIGDLARAVLTQSQESFNTTAGVVQRCAEVPERDRAASASSPLLHGALLGHGLPELNDIGESSGRLPWPRLTTRSVC